jgi:two-component system CitB family sensor kinase
MKLENRLRIYILTLLSISLFVASGVFLERELKLVEEKVQGNLKNVASLIARDPYIQKNVYEKSPDVIQDYVEKTMISLDEVDFIVVADMEGLRFSHVDREKVGKYFVGGDEKHVIETGESYFSKVKGTLGISLRRFEPLKYEGKQIGFVTVGRLYWKIQKVKKEAVIYFITALIMVILLSFIPASTLSHSIKKELMGFEPNEIGKMYEEKKTIFESIHEGIVAINQKGKITRMNRAAEEMLTNSKIDKLLNFAKETIDSGHGIYDREINLQNKKVFINSIPIFRGNIAIGVVLTLRDSEEINKRAKEITGFTQLIDSLRANIHEFKNKLHVILGLLELNEVEEAIKYITKLEDRVGESRFQNADIDDPILMALLTGKLNIAMERGVKLKLIKGSFIMENHGRVTTSDLVIIIGNLIENALEACEKSGWKNIAVYMKETEEDILIMVLDTGIPIPFEIEEIFENGISSKNGDIRGAGLALVKEKIDLYNGELEVNQKEGTKTFKIKIYKGETDDKSNNS